MIRRRIREDCSPRHVPDEIVQIAEVPRTLSGKVLEVPVKRILMGAAAREAASRESLANPAALDYFVELAAERIVTWSSRGAAAASCGARTATRVGSRACEHAGAAAGRREPRRRAVDRRRPAADVIARHLAERGAGETAAHEAGLAAIQVWQALSKTGRGGGTVDATILFTDLVGFSSWVLDAGDERGARAAAGGRGGRRAGDHVAPGPGRGAARRRAHGRVLRTRAPASTRRCRSRTDGRGRDGRSRPRLRPGQHLRAAARLQGRDYLGTDVNIAARVGAAAGAVRSWSRTQCWRRSTPDDLR